MCEYLRIHRLQNEVLRRSTSPVETPLTSVGWPSYRAQVEARFNDLAEQLTRVREQYEKDTLDRRSFDQQTQIK